MVLSWLTCSSLVCYAPLWSPPWNDTKTLRYNYWCDDFGLLVALYAHTPKETDPPGLLFPSKLLMSSNVTPLGRCWHVGGAWWAWWEPEPLVLIGAGNWIWTWGCDRPDFTSTSCWAPSTLIWGEHKRWWGVCCCSWGGEEAPSFLTGGGLFSDVTAAAIGVESGKGGTEGIAVTTGTIGMTAMGTWGGGREGAGGAVGWCGCWLWVSSLQGTWLVLTAWGEATISARLDSASVLMRSFSLHCSLSAGEGNEGLSKVQEK